MAMFEHWCPHCQEYRCDNTQYNVCEKCGRDMVLYCDEPDTDEQELDELFGYESYFGWEDEE